MMANMNVTLRTATHLKTCETIDYNEKYDLYHQENHKKEIKSISRHIEDEVSFDENVGVNQSMNRSECEVVSLVFLIYEKSF